ncbi:MAG: tetratricopeptide repeat protein [Bacillota bacterium]
MGSDAGRENSKRTPNYHLRRLLVVVVLLAAVALFVYTPTREFIKTTVLLGMPALVVWSYHRRFKRFSWTWWASSLILLALIAGYVFMLLGLPEKIAVKNIEREAGIYLTQGKYDQAIEKYRELEHYDRKDRMERKIGEAEKQKGYDASYRQARKMAAEGNYTEARRLLEEIPLEAIVYPQARELLRELEKD